MGWALIVVLALLAFAAMAWLLKAPRGSWEAIGAALLLGVAGYALQGSPLQPAAPKAAAEQQGDGKAQIDSGQALAAAPPGTNRWMVIADGLARNGRYADAAELLRGAVRDEPGNAEAWIALGNALVSHAEGNVTPAALNAYRRAEVAAPNHPGPPFFLGLALAQSGRLAEGREMWAQLLARSPADAPWRADLEQRLKQLDAFIAAQSATR